MARPLGADPQHRLVDVEHGDVGLGAARLESAEGDVAGTARDIEMLVGPGARRAQHRDQVRLPDPVQPTRHQVVHQVVAARDRAEHVVHLGLLLGKPHALVAEIGGGFAVAGSDVRSAHPIIPCARPSPLTASAEPP
jgi:hypothetical protein